MLLKLKVIIYSLISWFQECIIIKTASLSSCPSRYECTVLPSSLLSACQCIVQRTVFARGELHLYLREIIVHGVALWFVHCKIRNIFFFDSIGTCFILGLAAERRLQWKVTDPVNVFIWCIFYLSQNGKHVVFITLFRSCPYLDLLYRFEDLMNNVPLPEYTRRDGSRNLVSR